MPFDFPGDFGFVAMKDADGAEILSADDGQTTLPRELDQKEFDELHSSVEAWRGEEVPTQALEQILKEHGHKVLP